MTTIYYIPTYSGSCYLNRAEGGIDFDVRVLDTQGLLEKLALHAGIHHEQSNYVEIQVAYYQALLDFDSAHPDNMYHRSFAIDGMSVASTLLGWRDYLALCGWDGNVTLTDCERLNVLAKIEQYYTDNGLPQLLRKVNDALAKMKTGAQSVPSAYKQLEIVLPCDRAMLPDYLHGVFDALQHLGVKFRILNTEGINKSCKVTRMTFTQQWKAEAWLSQQDDADYAVWINRDNKRLDNWLHMSGKSVAGSKMMQSNPQITQLFLIAIQLFQRPLNVNVLVQYLLLPECPLEWELRKKLSDRILHEGGVCNEKVSECINNYLKDAADEEKSEKRKQDYRRYLPFDLLDKSVEQLAMESTKVSVEEVKNFVESLHEYTKKKEHSLPPYDIRIPQFRATSESFDSLLHLLETSCGGDMPIDTLQQWAQMLYDAQDYKYYIAQKGCRTVINSPANILSSVPRLVWCDFYGDSSQALSTDFLSPNEMKELTASGIKIWDPAHEADYYHMMQMRPLQLATDEVMLVSCQYSGATRLPSHPLACHVSVSQELDGDAMYSSLASKQVLRFDNHREADNVAIEFDASAHRLPSHLLRTTESFSALDSLLNNPFDYFMKYLLQFGDVYDTEFKASITFGNVAHEVIERLFTLCTDHQALNQYIVDHYEEEFNRALVAKGAYLLLPENHFDKNRLHFLLFRCVNNLAAIIIENKLKVVACEQNEAQNLGFPNQIIVKGFIDMVLKDALGRKVVFDLKWTSKKDKHKKLVESNRATQLAIYQAFLSESGNVRTAFFTMPEGKLITKDEFAGKHVDKLTVADVDLMEQLRKGYSTRLEQLERGVIETADGVELSELEYMQTEGVFPVDNDGKKKFPKKAANAYSDYKCFIN